jgi:hypothetical protein
LTLILDSPSPVKPERRAIIIMTAPLALVLFETLSRAGIESLLFNLTPVRKT